MHIDLNCDLGESFGHYKLGEQEEILHYISSINIACGFHAGDPSVMHDTVKLALKHNVAIGAHPGLPDLVGFGRREMNISAQEAYDLTVYQVGALQGFVHVQGGTLQHVKPHGALYNMAAKRTDLAKAIAQAVYDLSPTLYLFGLANSELTKAADNIGLRAVHEVFADRTYQPDGTLTPRTQPDALIHDEQQVIEQMLKMATNKTVTACNGHVIPLQADSICLHGDGPHALAFAKLAHEQLTAQGIHIKSFR